MRGILILCGGSGAGRRGYGQRRERGWPEGVRPTRGGEERGGGGSSGGAKDDTSETPTGRPKGVRGAAGCGRGDGTPGRRDAGAQTRSRRGVGTTRRRPKRVGGRVRAVPEGGDTGSGGSVGGRRECGRPEGGEERGGGGVARTAEGNGRRERGTRTRRPEGVRPAGESRKEEVGKRAGAAGALNRSIEGPLGGEDGVAEVEGQVHVLPRVDLVLGQRQAHRPDGRVVDQ